MVLRSDSKKLLEEFAAAGESSQEDVTQKWKSLVCERKEVGDCSVHLFRSLSYLLVFGCYARVGETRGTSKGGCASRCPEAKN